ncbi:AAA family ATPase [Streptomyces sp. NPDC059985]|uniref:AAA family ATPase n=1 Tax=Streptomyces sp. NPDC059985 TaxID=3347025 RepID=UPI0036C9A798
MTQQISTPEPDDALTAAARALLLAFHPAARFDATGKVAVAGFLCSPGAPGHGQVRVSHRTPFPSVLNGLTFADAEAEEYVLVSAYADLLREHGWSVRELGSTRPGLLLSPPGCPACSGPTEPFQVEGEAVWRCPSCRRRTYGTADSDRDFELPTYTETDADGGVTVYHGTGEVDIEATAEWAAQDDPEDVDLGLETATTRFLVIPALDLVPGTLLVAVGPGASGKSTYAQTAAVDAVVCLDSLRREIGGDAGDQSVTPAAVERQNALLEQHLNAGTTVFLDSTNVEPHVRAGLVERARRLGRPVVALRFLPDLDTCLIRNALRPDNRRVPEDTLRWQHDLTREATPDVLLGEGFTAVHHIEPIPTGVTMSDDVLAPERIADAVAVLREAQQGDQEAHRDLGNYFPEYEGLVMQTDHVRYLELGARAGLEATHLLIMHIDSDTWGASVDTYTCDLGMPLASVNLGDYASRTEAVRETVRAATETGWMLAPEHEWADFDCGGGEIHIPIHARPGLG